jgi:hypothetical protein
MQDNAMKRGSKKSTEKNNVTAHKYNSSIVRPLISRHILGMILVTIAG